MDKLANMQAFAAVSETGSFAEAARRLGIANSVISKRVKDLEDYLGAPLFVRTTRQVSLTDTGYGYLEHVRKFLDDMDEVESGIRHNMEKPVGTIRLAAPMSFGTKLLGRAVSSYLLKYPEVSVRSYMSDRRVDLAQEGFDLAIRIGSLDDSSIIAKKLVNSRRVVCASPAYFKANGKPKTPADLKNHNCLSYLNLAEGKSWPLVVDGRKIWQPVSGRFSSDSGEFLYEAALTGCGVALLPTFIVGDALKKGLLETALEQYEETDFNIYAVYHHTRHLSAKIRTFIDHLAEHFGREYGAGL